MGDPSRFLPVYPVRPGDCRNAAYSAQPVFYSQPPWDRAFFLGDQSGLFRGAVAALIVWCVAGGNTLKEEGGK